MSVAFQKDENGMKALAAYVAELTRQGVTFDMTDGSVMVRVTLMGGF